MKLKSVFFTGALCLIAGICFTGMNFNQPQYNIIIPSLEEVRENGYPVNEIGQTYGPYLGYGMEPDLITAHGISSNGDKITGYIKRSEDDEPTTLEEALAYKPLTSVDLYTQDGKTKIGIFKLTQ